MRAMRSRGNVLLATALAWLSPVCGAPARSPGGGEGAAGAGGGAVEATDSAPDSTKTVEDGGAADAHGAAPHTPLIEDFEAYDERTLLNGQGLGPWTVQVNGPTKMQIDARKPYAGHKALRITAPGGAVNHGVLAFASPLLPQDRNVIYGRAMFFISAPPGDCDLELDPRCQHWWSAFGTSGVAIDPNNGRPVPKLIWTWGGEFHNWASATYSDQWCRWLNPGYNIKFNQWVCYRWKFGGKENTIGAPDPSLEVWAQDQAGPIVRVRGVPTECHFRDVPWLIPKMTSGFIGFTNQQPTAVATVNDMEVWVDDIVLDTAPVDCPVAP